MLDEPVYKLCDNYYLYIAGSDGAIEIVFSTPLYCGHIFHM